MTFLFDTLPRDIYFTLFNQRHSHLHDLLRKGLTGGPSLIFHRHHEVGVTHIRHSLLCRAIVGYDANALCLWSISQNMPTGYYIYRTAESNFKPKQSRKYGQTSLAWLEWLSHSQIFVLNTNLTEKNRGSAIVIFPLTDGVQRRKLLINFTGVFFTVAHAKRSTPIPSTGSRWPIFCRPPKRILLI